MIGRTRNMRRRTPTVRGPLVALQSGRPLETGGAVTAGDIQHAGGRWEPLATSNNGSTPEIVFYQGDVVMVFIRE